MPVSPSKSLETSPLIMDSGLWLSLENEDSSRNSPFFSWKLWPCLGDHVQLNL